MKLMKKKLLWKLFLLTYLVMLGFHIAEMDFSSEWFLTALLGGFLIALIAHRKAHILSVLLLLIHMVIEAMEFGAGGIVGAAVVGFFVHVALDVTFLYGEVGRHFAKAKWPIFSSAIIAVGSIYAFFPGSVHAENLTSPWMAYFAIGGVIGCVLSHIIPHKHPENS